MTILGTLLALLLTSPLAHAQDDEGHARVVGGAQAPDGAWEDAAGIVFGNQGVSCTGTLIHPRVVLTAGHCVQGYPQPSSVILATNNYNYPGEQIDIQSVHEYPNSWQTYDIAVLVLERDAVTEPRVVAQGCILDEYLYNGAPVAIVGYGSYDEWGNYYDSKLREAFTTVVDHDCSFSSGCNWSVSPGGEIGAGGYGVDACYGDSGGPLYLLTDRGDYLIGVTSRAFGNVNVPCGEGGIWVRPDAVMDWIEDVSGYEIPYATCNIPPSPTAPDITAVQGERTPVQIFPHDPDGDAADVSYALADGPFHGTVEVHQNGWMIYTSNPNFLSQDEFTITVTDGGVPPLSADVTVNVTVVKGGCGCQTSGMAWSGLAALPLLGFLAARRRRR